ncbi:MAG: TPM domain-containing protein, partial [bacterium]|nr:TPM domain-containing protein [bacterium]
VMTVLSLDGATVANAAERAFAQQSVNGILIYIAKAEHADYILPDRAARSIFPPQETSHILSAMNSSFKQGDFDGGITNAVGLILDTYGSHQQRARTAPYAGQHLPANGSSGSQGGFNLGFLWWILIIIAIFWIVRAIVRSASGGFNRGPGGPGGPGYGPGYGGGMGYGPGYGWGGGGGFWSGLLGGLGGAWLGNELFGQHGNVGNVGTAGTFGDPNATPDASAYQADPGQADPSAGAGGGWADPGGGWGGGDPGGGWGGGDSGGGWGGGGDSGGGGGW